MRKDDGALVEAVRAGRRELFAELVDRHAAAVFRLVRAGVGHHADVEDIAQEAFLASFRSLDRLRDPARFRSHLLTIASRKVVDFYRRRRPKEQTLDPAEEPPAPAPAEAPALVDVIERIVRGLDPQSRLVFALRHHEGLSCVQIAELLDVPAGTVYSRLSRTHAVIRRRAEVTGS